MEALVGSLVALVVGQAGLLWYKLGKVEGKLSTLTNLIINNNGKEG